MAPPAQVLLAKRCLLLVFLIVNTVTARFICDQTKLGNPAIGDCDSLFNKLPYATMLPGPDLWATRWFVEPQYLPKPFTPINSPRSQGSMVQLPKIWRTG